MQVVVGLLKVGKELVKTYIEMVKKVTNTLVDNGNFVDEGLVISSKFYSEMYQNVGLSGMRALSRN